VLILAILALNDGNVACNGGSTGIGEAAGLLVRAGPALQAESERFVRVASAQCRQQRSFFDSLEVLYPEPKSREVHFA
jgi:hypothetical protein